MWPFPRRLIPRRSATLTLVVVTAAAALVSCGGDTVKPVRAGAGCSPTQADVSCSVLFLGNSYTATNDLPDVFTKLAGSGGLAVSTAANALGGMTLARHVAASDTATMLNDTTFNVVVIQEQSQIPASPELAAAEMFPAATALAEHTHRVGAQPLLLQTWAHRDGWPEAGIATYEQMQEAITGSYDEIAQALSLEVAPVGEAWARERSDPAHPDLWRKDGSHPTVSGTYLAACVLFATVFHRSPQGLTYHDGLSARVASELQAVAWAVAH